MRKFILSAVAAATILGAASAAQATQYFYDPDTGLVTKACDLYYDAVWNEYHRRCRAM
jgi:hypothetical protein